MYDMHRIAYRLIHVPKLRPLEFADLLQLFITGTVLETVEDWQTQRVLPGIQHKRRLLRDPVNAIVVGKLQWRQ